MAAASTSGAPATSASPAAAATAVAASASSATPDAVSILKRAILKEGMLFKSAAAKGKDQMRGNWKDRWFVLKKNTLSYFKAKGETKEKGAIDLRVRNELQFRNGGAFHPLLIERCDAIFRRRKWNWWKSQ